MRHAALHGSKSNALHLPVVECNPLLLLKIRSRLIRDFRVSLPRP